MLSENEIRITPSEFQMWKAMGITQAVFDALNDERSCWVQRLAFGETLESHDALKETARAVGIVLGLSILLEDLEIVILEQWNDAQRRKEEEESGE